MKKNAFIIAGFVALAAIGYWAYRKFWQPSITLNQIDWQNGFASMTIDGKVYKVTSATGINLGRGFSVEMEQAFRNDLGKDGPVNVVLKKDGMTVKIISYFQQ